MLKKTAIVVSALALVAASPSLSLAKSLKSMISHDSLVQYCSTNGVGEFKVTVTLPSGETVNGTLDCEEEDVTGTDDSSASSGQPGEDDSSAEQGDDNEDSVDDHGGDDHEDASSSEHEDDSEDDGDHSGSSGSGGHDGGHDGGDDGSDD